MKLSFPVRIYLIALFLRVIPILLTRGLGIGLDDMFQYDMLARSLASGNGYRWYTWQDLDRLKPYVHFDLTTAKGYDPARGLYTSFRAPLYPAFRAIIYFFNGIGFSRFFAARMAQAVFLGAPLAPLTYYVAKPFFIDEPNIQSNSLSILNERKIENIAKISARIVASYPILLVYPWALSTENLFFVLLLVSFLFLLNFIDKPTTLNFLASGIFLGLTVLTRSVILPFVGLAMLYLIYLHRRGAFLVGLAFIVVIAPWIVRNSLLHHKLTGIETSMGYNLYLGYYPQGDGSFVFGPSLDLLSIMDDAEVDRVGIQKAVGFIRQQPERFIPLAVNRLGLFFGLDKRALMYLYANNLFGYISSPFLLAIAAVLMLPFVFISVSATLGLSLLRWNSQTVLLFLLIIGYLLPHVFILSEDRFHMALIPFFSILAALFWVSGFSSFPARWRTSTTGKYMVVLVVLGVCLLFVNWGMELSRDADKIAVLLGPYGNRVYFPY